MSLLFTQTGRADTTPPVQIVFQPAEAHRSPPYTLTGTVPPFSVPYARADGADITFFHALTIKKDFTNSGTGTAAYTVDGNAEFSLAFDGITKLSDILSIHKTGNVGPGNVGTVGDTVFASPSISLEPGATPRVTFVSAAATQVTPGATVETFGSASIVYSYTPIGQSAQDAIPTGSATNAVYSLTAAPTGRWFASPPARRIRYDAASADGSFSSITFPAGATGTFQVLADGVDNGNFQPGSTVNLPAGTKTLVVSQIAPAGKEGDSAVLPLLLNFNQSAVDLNISSFDPAFFAGETVLLNGVSYLQFAGGTYFGYYSFLSDPRYLYHFDLGYEYVIDAADGNAGVYLYDFKSGGFFYTSPTFPFPYLYDFTLDTVLYYYPDPNNPGRYNTDGVRSFYNFNTGMVIVK